MEDKFKHRVDEIQALRLLSKKSDRDATAKTRELVGELEFVHGFTRRESAKILGLSHQRINQILNQTVTAELKREKER